MPERRKYTRRAELFRSISDGYEMLDSPLSKPYQQAAKFFDQRAAEAENRVEQASRAQAQDR